MLKQFYSQVSLLTPLLGVETSPSAVSSHVSSYYTPILSPIILSTVGKSKRFATLTTNVPQFSTSLALAFLTLDLVSSKAWRYVESIMSKIFLGEGHIEI